MMTKRRLRERVAGLEARNKTLLQQWTEIRKERESWKWSTKKTVQQLGDVRREHRARLDRALRACARYRAELAQQQRVNDNLADRLMGAMGYGPAQLLTLGLPPAPEQAPAPTGDHYEDCPTCNAGKLVGHPCQQCAYEARLAGELAARSITNSH